MFPIVVNPSAELITPAATIDVRNKGIRYRNHTSKNTINDSAIIRKFIVFLPSSAIILTSSPTVEKKTTGYIPKLINVARINFRRLRRSDKYLL